MPVKSALKSRILDDKDRKILAILQVNSRESLTNIAKKVNLSIDSVNNRIKSMQEKKIIEKFGVWINTKELGYNLITDNKIKMHNITEEQTQKFIAHLRAHPNVIDLLSVMGDFDFTCVIVAKNTSEYNKISLGIRQKFSGIIADWKSMLILEQYKFEEYDLI
jgi:Lrp/AsnC family leucine-responsive transcriptional regulator